MRECDSRTGCGRRDLSALEDRVRVGDLALTDVVLARRRDCEPGATASTPQVARVRACTDRSMQRTAVGDPCRGSRESEPLSHDQASQFAPERVARVRRRRAETCRVAPSGSGQCGRPKSPSCP